MGIIRMKIQALDWTMGEVANVFGYLVHSSYDMLVPEPELTESDIFNEFWIRW